MNPDVAVASVFSQYANFSGRARRSEYWWFALFNIVAGFALSLLDSMVNVPVFSAIFFIGTVIPNLAVTVRRFHDTDHTGWWLLTAFIPLVGFIVMLVLTLSDSQRGSNRYGPSPKYSEYAGQSDSYRP